MSPGLYLSRECIGSSLCAVDMMRGRGCSTAGHLLWCRGVLVTGHQRLPWFACSLGCCGPRWGVGHFYRSISLCAGYTGDWPWQRRQQCKLPTLQRLFPSNLEHSWWSLVRRSAVLKPPRKLNSQGDRMLYRFSNCLHHLRRDRQQGDRWIVAKSRAGCFLWMDTTFATLQEDGWILDRETRREKSRQW